MAKCTVMDYETGEIRIINVSDNPDTEDIEEMLTEQYEYSLDAIHWMISKDIKLIIE